MGWLEGDFPGRSVVAGDSVACAALLPGGFVDYLLRALDLCENQIG